ncbi:MAG: protein-disulfide reductase DsbD domain-containing protein, partial [Pseudomonadota bacterium]
MKQLQVLFFTFVFALAAAIGARAQMVVENDYTTTQIIPEAKGFAPGETMLFAVRQELLPKWHVFWVNPGDAGLPLSLDWDLPEGFSTGPISHPVPEYIPVGPLASFAHEDEPVFLVSVTAPDDLTPGEIVEVAIDAQWQACEEICVPESGRFSFSLPVLDSVQSNPAVAQIFSNAKNLLPETTQARGTLESAGEKFRLRIAAPAGFVARDAFFFPEPEGLIKPAGAQAVSLEEGEAVVDMIPGWIDSYNENIVKGILSFKGESGTARGVSLVADVPAPLTKPERDPAPLPQGAANVPLLLLFAFLGGVILNIMPCVFPVVFIKAASFMQSAREHPQTVRLHGLLYTGGVLATFLLMGGALLALRAGGEQFGWGFHLQSPWVVALSAYILFLVGLNLSGVFSVGGGLAGAGENLAAKPGGAGAFFTGALAVVVAAPCIGPLLSAPMGAALFLPPFAGMAIFAALGLGLAAPYLFLSFTPGLGERLPKPGPWMNIFKQALAFPVFAAAAYFLWVLAQQASGAGLAAVLAGAVLIAFSAWMFEISKADGTRALVLRVVSALAAVAALAPLTRLEAVAETPIAMAQKHGAMSAVPFSEEAL